MYLDIGNRIFEEEHAGKDRAGYGEYLTKFIAQELEPELGSGYSRRQIELFRQFYRPTQLRTYCVRNWVGRL